MGPIRKVSTRVLAPPPQDENVNRSNSPNSGTKNGVTPAKSSGKKSRTKKITAMAPPPTKTVSEDAKSPVQTPKSPAFEALLKALTPGKKAAALIFRAASHGSHKTFLEDANLSPQSANSFYRALKRSARTNVKRNVFAPASTFWLPQSATPTQIQQLASRFHREQCSEEIQLNTVARVFQDMMKIPKNQPARGLYAVSADDDRNQHTIYHWSHGAHGTSDTFTAFYMLEDSHVVLLLGAKHRDNQNYDVFFADEAVAVWRRASAPAQARRIQANNSVCPF